MNPEKCECHSCMQLRFSSQVDKNTKDRQETDAYISERKMQKSIRDLQKINANLVRKVDELQRLNTAFTDESMAKAPMGKH